MNLIFVTRKLDRGDFRTGFIFSWVEKLAGTVSSLKVICLEQGPLGEIPDNVTVVSMGKEQGFSRVRLLLNYWQMLWRFLPASQGVFIHMHPVYAIAAWPLTKIYRKILVLWYVHKSVDMKLKIATFLVDKILTASKDSFRIQSPKVRVVGHGIDLRKFSSTPLVSRLSSPEISNETKLFTMLSLGRISPIKDYETLIRAVKNLWEEGVRNIRLDIYGAVDLSTHQAYLDSLINFVHGVHLEGVVRFQGPLMYDDVDEVYRGSHLFISSSQTGSMDKTVLEAAASGTIVLTSNKAFRGALEKISKSLYFERDNPADIQNKIMEIKAWSGEKKQAIRKSLQDWVSVEHNLDHLVKLIIGEFK